MSAVSESPGADRTLEALLERVKGATGPAWDIDREVAILVCRMGGPQWQMNIEPVSSSLDATLALCERVLPDADWMVDQRSGRPAMGFVFPRGRPYRRCDAATPALALLAALLEALVKSRSPSLAGG